MLRGRGCSSLHHASPVQCWQGSLFVASCQGLGVFPQSSLCCYLSLDDCLPVVLQPVCWNWTVAIWHVLHGVLWTLARKPWPLNVHRSFLLLNISMPAGVSVTGAIFAVVPFAVWLISSLMLAGSAARVTGTSRGLHIASVCGVRLLVCHSAAC